MSINLTRAQRRQMQKLADKVDKVTQADRLFFERRPERKHRVRLASQAELDQQALLEGQMQEPPHGCRVFTIVRNIADGLRLRLYAFGLEGAETDLSEETARAIYEMAATPRSREIEARLREAAGARA